MDRLEWSWMVLRNQCNRVCDKWLNEWDRILSDMAHDEYTGQIDEQDMETVRDDIVQLVDLPFHLFDVADYSFDSKECDTIDDEVIALFEGQMDSLGIEMPDEFFEFAKKDIDALLETLGKVGDAVDNAREDKLHLTFPLYNGETFCEKYYTREYVVELSHTGHPMIANFGDSLVDCQDCAAKLHKYLATTGDVVTVVCDSERGSVFIGAYTTRELADKAYAMHKLSDRHNTSEHGCGYGLYQRKAVRVNRMPKYK